MYWRHLPSHASNTFLLLLYPHVCNDCTPYKTITSTSKNPVHYSSAIYLTEPSRDRLLLSWPCFEEESFVQRSLVNQATGFIVLHSKSSCSVLLGILIALAAHQLIRHIPQSLREYSSGRTRVKDSQYLCRRIHFNPEFRGNYSTCVRKCKSGLSCTINDAGRDCWLRRRRSCCYWELSASSGSVSGFFAGMIERKSID